MNGEIRIDAALATDVIRESFPVLRQSQAKWIGEGYDSVAFEIGGEWVFRFPKRDGVEQQILLEIRLLPVLARHSPLRVPEYQFEGTPTRRFPRHFGGYRKVAGVPGIELDPDSLPLNRLAPSLATFLSVLHTFSTDHATGLGVAHQDADGCLAEAKADALEDFEYVTRAAPDLVVPGWVELLSEAPAGPAESHRTDCLVHGDLAAEHILYGSATRSLTGVIDWSEVSIGDPSVDLAAAFHWGGTRFLDMVLSTYRGPADDGARDRARYRAACRGIGDIVFGIELERAEYVAAGVRALNFSLAR